MALNLKTGDVVWNKKIASTRKATATPPAPLIVNGLVITGNSGGEFGIVGEVQARDAATGETVWTRPVIEGHMGTLNGKESTMTGTLNATWPGDMWKSGGGATWLGGSYDADTNTLVFGAGNPAPWNSWLRNAGTPTEGNVGDNLYAASRLGSTPPRARSSGTSRPRRAKAGTMTVVKRGRGLRRQGRQQKFATGRPQTGSSTS